MSKEVADMISSITGADSVFKEEEGEINMCKKVDEWIENKEREILERVTRQVNEGVTEKMREEIKARVTEEVTEDVREEIKKEVTEDVREEIKKEVTEDVREEVTNQIKAQVTEEVTNQVTAKNIKKMADVLREMNCTTEEIISLIIPQFSLSKELVTTLV